MEVASLRCADPKPGVTNALLMQLASPQMTRPPEWRAGVALPSIASPQWSKWSLRMAHSRRVGLVGDGVLLRRLVQPRGEGSSGTKVARKALPTYGDNESPLSKADEPPHISTPKRVPLHAPLPYRNASRNHGSQNAVTSLFPDVQHLLLALLAP